MTQDRKTVLVVEDSPIQAAALIEFLRRQGLRVLHAPNGRIGVSMARQHMPDAIVLDVEMPEMDGFEACRQLRQDPRMADIPIVMLTVRDEPQALLQGLNQRATDFIPKDAFSYAVLLETLHQLYVLDEASVGAEPTVSEMNPIIGEDLEAERRDRGDHDAES